MTGISEMQRSYQGGNFIVTGLDNKPIAELLGLFDTDGNNVLAVYLKVENEPWQRFFLDAWAGFWREFDEMPDELERGDVLIDYTELYSLRNKKIGAIVYRGQYEISIQDVGVFILRLIDPEIDDTNSEVLFEEKMA